MVAITIRDLHMKTGDWIRKAARHEGIVVLDRKHPVARIVPFREEESGVSFADRKLVRGFRKMAPHNADSAAFISEERDRV